MNKFNDELTIYLGHYATTGGGQSIKLEGFYAGRRGKNLVTSNNQSCAKRFKTNRGARQAVRKLKKDYDIAHTLITNRFFPDINK